MVFDRNENQFEYVRCEKSCLQVAMSFLLSAEKCAWLAWKRKLDRRLREQLRNQNNKIHKPQNFDEKFE